MILIRVIPFFFCFFCAVLWEKTSWAAPSETDILIVPGERVGPVLLKMSEEDLHRIIKSTQIKRSIFYLGEGSSVCSTILYPETDRELTVVWGWGDNDEMPAAGPEVDQANLERCAAKPLFKTIEFVLIQSHTIWATREGLRVGDNLLAVERANHAPIQFSTCECDGDGTIMDWTHGVYSRRDVSGDITDGLGPEGREDLEVVEALYGQDRSEMLSSQLSDHIKTKLFLDSLFVYHFLN